MGKKMQKVLAQIVLALLVIVLQVLSVRIGFFYKPLLYYLEFGLQSGGLLIAMEGLNLLSGIVLAWLPGKKVQDDGNPEGTNYGLILLLGLSLLFVIEKVLLMGFGVLWSMDGLLAIMPTTSAFGEWAFLTPIPSLLAGFSLGSILRR